MRIAKWASLGVALMSAVMCGDAQELSASRAAAVEQSVRAFAKIVAHDVTEEGPTAWRKHFADTPSFFMASDGRLAFKDSASATAGIRGYAPTIRHIELQWGDDLRVDPLTADLAVMAASWHEIRVSTSGERIDERGFFTAVVEHRGGRWQFRDAHWSVASPAK